MDSLRSFGANRMRPGRVNRKRNRLRYVF